MAADDPRLLESRRRVQADPAHHSPDLKLAVETVQHAVSPPAKTETTSTPTDDLFDFDALLAQLGVGTEPTGPSTRVAGPANRVPSEFDKVELLPSDSDPFAVLERDLRESEEHRVVEGPAAAAARHHKERALAELEDWLAAIITDRGRLAAS